MRSGSQTAGLLMRRRVLRGLLFALSALVALSICTATASAEGTTTTGVGIPLVTTAPPVTTTADATAAATGGTAVAPGGVGVTPAPPGWQPLNPGISPAEIFVQIWPEYDTSSTEVLVLVNLTVPDSVPLPFTFKYAVPKGARVTGFALVTPSGEFDYNRPNPQFSPGGADWDLVTVTVPTSRQIHLEYYYNPGMPASGVKKFNVDFISPADTLKLIEAVQQPLRSTAFSIDPPGVDGTPDAEGYNYKTVTFANVKDGDRARIEVSYTKSDSDPSKPAGGTATADQSQSSRWFIILLIVLVVVVVGLVVYRLFFRKAPKLSGSQSRPRQSGGARQSGGGGSGQSSGGGSGQSGGGGSGPSRFCTQCGGKLTKRDRFCPQCGSERES